MTTLHEVIAMPDGSGVVLKKDTEPDFSFKDGMKFIEHLVSKGDVLLTINRKEPLEGVPNVNTKQSTSLRGFYEWYKEANAAPRATVINELQNRLKQLLPAQVEIEWTDCQNSCNWPLCGMLNCVEGKESTPRIKHLHGQPQVKLIYK